jgi:hypothetical protein
MMVHQWLLRWLAIGWVLVPAAASRVRLGACASGVVDTLAMAAFSSETSPKNASCCCGLSSCVSCMLAFSCPRLSRDIFQPPLSSSSARLTSWVLMDTLTVMPRSRWKRRRAGHNPAHSGRQDGAAGPARICGLGFRGVAPHRLEGWGGATHRPPDSRSARVSAA